MNAPKTVPPPSIALSFFATGIATLGATLAWSLAGNLSPLALLHLLVVGVFAMVAMGALYQFVPVVGMSPLRSTRLPFLHLGLAGTGTVLLVYGFQSGEFPYVITGGALHIAGALLESFILIATLWKRQGAGMPARLATVAFAWFTATAAAGIASATGTLTAGTHATIGLAGFYGTLITAVTFRLLRMFERINVEPRAPLRVIAVTIAAITAAVTPRTGSILLAVVAGLLLADLFDIARRRNPAYQPETLLYALLSMLGGLLAAVAAAYGMWLQAVTVAVWFFAGGAVVGHSQRIVPFIWWIRRSKIEGARNIPNLGEINSSALGFVILVLWTAAGVWWLFTPFARAPAAVGLAAWAVLALQLARPFVLRKRVPAA
ncbi:MAG TPA: hypothetical protein VKT72_03450 [Candidatus Baltobacteraceae bacterium]|nr:hypothetical protein [Candidatus Baltobacteraceae bacterium]